MNRDQVNEQLRRRGWKELGPSPVEQQAEAAVEQAQDDEARRPPATRDSLTPMEVMRDQLVRRGFTPPDAA